MFLATSYTTDNNLVLPYSVALYIGYVDEYPVQNIANIFFVPAILIPQLQWSNHCFTKQVIARYILITLSSNQIFKIAYPFRPNSPEWNIFWEQLQSPEIVSIKRFGEKTTDKFLRNSLGVL